MADGRVILDTEIDSSGAEKGLGKLGTGLQKIGGAALKGASAAVGSATTAIVGMTKAAVDSYAEFEQLKGGVETLFGTGGKSIDEYAKSVGKSVESVKGEYSNLEKAQAQVMKNADDAYKNAGMSANEYMDTVTSFSASLIASLDGDTVKAAQVADVAITDMADNANKMGTDISMIQNAYQGFAKQNYTMLDNLKLGYGGTQKEMQRLLDDAGKLAGKKFDTSNFSDVAEAIHIIQEEMGIAGATSDEAATTIQGSVGMMKAAYENFLTGMADPSSDFDSLVNNLIDSVMTVLQNLVPRIISTVPRLVEGLSQLLQQVAGYIPQLMEMLVPPLMEGVSNLANVLVEIFPQVMTIISSLLPQLIGLIMQILPQVLEVGIQIIVQLAQGLAQGAPDLLTQLIDLVVLLVETVIDNLPLIVEAGLELIVGLAEGLVEAIPQLLDKIPMLIDKIISTLISLIPSIIDAGIKLFVSLVENMPVIITSICNAIPKIIDSIVSNIESLVPLIIDAGVKLFVALVKNLPLIIATSYVAVGKIVTSILGALMDALPRFYKAGYDLLVGILGKIGEACKWLGDKMKTVVTAMKEAITKKIKEFTTIGKNIIEGVWNGIKGMKDTITKNVSNFFGGIVDTVKKKLDIHSPSKVFQTIGQNIAQGTINGIQKLYGKAKKTSAELATIIYDTAKQKWDYYNKYNDYTLTSEVAFWEKIVKQTKKGTQGYKDAQLALKTAKEELNTQLTKLEEDYESNVAKVKDNLIKDIQAVTDAYDNALNKRKDAILGSMDIFKEFASTTENSTESLLSNLQGQVDALQTWDSVLDSLEQREGMNMEFFTQLQEMGPSVLADLQLINAMTDEQLQQYIALWDQKNILAGNRAMQELSDYREECEAEIEELINSANTELNTLEADFKASLKELGQQTADTSVNIGKGIVQGLKEGIQSSEGELNSFLTSFFNGIKSTANNALAGIMSAYNTAVTQSANSVNSTLQAQAAAGGGGGFTQIVNVNQPVATPDEMAQATRVEARYTPVEGLV